MTSKFRWLLGATSLAGMAAAACAQTLTVSPAQTLEGRGLSVMVD